MLLDYVKTEKLAEWAYLFNRWKWPDDYFYKKPQNFDFLPNFSEDDIGTKYYFIHNHTERIESLIGRKECLRYMHLRDIIDYNYQFETWWFITSLNGFGQRLIDKNFYIDLYDLLKWRKK